MSEIVLFPYEVSCKAPACCCILIVHFLLFLFNCLRVSHMTRMYLANFVFHLFLLTSPPLLPPNFMSSHFKSTEST